MKPLAYLATTRHLEQGLYFLEDEAKAYSESDTTSPDLDNASVVPLIAIPPPLSDDEERVRFEKAFPRPCGIYFKLKSYCAKYFSEEDARIENDYNSAWYAWQAAVADFQKRMEE